MGTNELTLERALPIWWAFTWRAALSAGVAGLFVGFVGGFIVGAAGSPELGRPVGAVLAWVAAIPCSIWAFREALRVSYQGFDIALVGRVTPVLASATSKVAPAAALNVTTGPATAPRLSVGLPPGRGNEPPENAGVWPLVGILASVVGLVLVGLIVTLPASPTVQTPPTDQASTLVTAASAPAAAVSPMDTSLAASTSTSSDVANQVVDAPAPEPTSPRTGLTAPDLSQLNDDERQSIQMACGNDKALNGPAAYDRCLINQMSRMTPDIQYPDLSVLNQDERQSIQMACGNDKALNGPADYDRCLAKKLAELGR